MLLRFLIFVAFQFVGAALGWYFYEAWGALAGSVSAAWLWFVMDLLRNPKIFLTGTEHDLSQLTGHTASAGV